MKPLGETQLAVLESLRQHGDWYDGCGWTWSNGSGTTRIMESLVKRGLVTKREEHRFKTVYSLVEKK